MDTERHITLCAKCSESYSQFLFEFGIPFRCRCGSLVSPPTARPPADPAPVEREQHQNRDRARRRYERVAQSQSENETGLKEEENKRARELQRRAERICYLIASTDAPRNEIELEMKELRVRCGRYFPEMRGAYERIYEGRFQKLWREFRTP